MMRKPALLMLLALLIIPTIIQAQDKPIFLGAGLYEAEDLPWTMWGEWSTKTESGRTYLTSGSKDSSLSITVKGMYVLIYRVPEYGGGEMYVRMNDCVELYLSQSAHDIGIGTLLDIEGETDLTLQLGAGRLAIDAIEVMTDSTKAQRLISESSIRNLPQNQRINVAYLNRQINWEGDIPAKDCVKKPPPPTAVPPTATPFGYIAPIPQPPAVDPLSIGPSASVIVVNVCVGLLVIIPVLGVAGWALNSIDSDNNKKKNG